MLDRLDVNDNDNLSSGTNILLEVEVEALVQKDGNSIVAVDRLDKSIDGEITDISIAICQTKRESRLLQRLLKSKEYLVRGKRQEVYAENICGDSRRCKSPSEVQRDNIEA